MQRRLQWRSLAAPCGRRAATSAPFCGFAPPWQASVYGPTYRGQQYGTGTELATRCYDQLPDFFRSTAIAPDRFRGYFSEWPRIYTEGSTTP